MGTYTSLTISGYELYSSKSYVIPVIMTIFRESDKQIFKRRRSSLVELPWDSQVDDFEDDIDDGIEIVCRYLNTAANIKQRLDAIGFSLENLKVNLAKGSDNVVKQIQERLEETEDEINDVAGDSKLAAQITLLKKSTLQDWCDAAIFIFKNNLHVWEFQSWREISPDFPPLVRYVFDGSQFDDSINWFPVSDIRYVIRLFLEACNSDDLVIQDISEVVNSGYYEIDEKVCQNSIEMLTGDYPTFSKIIILTEGSTDRLILESSLRLLYPHMVDFYSFLDFDVSNVQGGASSLVSTVKAFSASGIANRAIAIFDNDTAAFIARKGLDKVSLPSNIKIISYPDLELARNYPTIGPSGVTEMDVNGLAGSIELYLGRDVLTVNGELVSVQWKGYMEGVGKYQGEVLRKKSLQEAFVKKVDQCKADNKVLLSTDWDALNLIWQKIFLCFA